MTRYICIFCKNYLKLVYTTDSHTSFSPSSYKDEILQFVQDIKIGQCDKCYSLQYIDLINPELLYKNSHNDTSATPTWKKHHDAFFDFCEQTVVYKNNILEIGGAQLILAKKFTEIYTDIKYIIIDFIEKDTENDRIYLKNGNCEDYAFKYETVIMSHVFEHLHNPSTFLENISKSNVTTIILSVPNMQQLLLEDNINLISIEHTFYFTPTHLFNLFGKYSFQCTKQVKFMNHSDFFCFERTHDLFNEIVYDTTHKSLLNTFFSRRKERFDSILFKETDTNIWIVPAGHYGYVIYQELLKRALHKNVKGLLDNDKSKQNKYIASSSLCIHPFETIKSELNPTILLYGGPYTQELKTQILSLNVNCSFITF